MAWSSIDLGEQSPVTPATMYQQVGDQQTVGWTFKTFITVYYIAKKWKINK